MMESQILFDPILPKTQIFLLWAFLIGLAAASLIRSRGSASNFKVGLLFVLRALALSGLCVLLLRPMAVEPHAELKGRPAFTVLVDASLSMATEDVEGGSRWDAVAAAFKSGEAGFIRDLRTDHDVEFATFAEDYRATSLGQVAGPADLRGNKTDLSGALFNAGRATSGRDKAGVLLVSDGRDNQAGDTLSAANYLKSMNVPVWTTSVGGLTESKDLYLTARLTQNFLYKGQPGTLKVDLNQTGYKGWYAQVELFREEESIAVEQVMLKGNSERLRFPIQEEEQGVYRYTVQVRPLQGEADRTNNLRSVMARVVDERSKVLLIEAQPYWDSKFLLRTLQADPNLEVTSIFYINDDKILAVAQKDADNPDEKETAPARIRTPRTKEELFKYDCVILGRDIDTIYDSDELKMFKAYVEERGGSLVFSRGKSYSFRNEILGQIEPVVWGEGTAPATRFELTPAGSVSPVFDFDRARSAGLIIRELPEMISMTKVEETKSLAVVLAKGRDLEENSEIATVSYQRLGKGKTMSVGTTGLWRWSFMPERNELYDEVYAKFWGQMIRWLVYGSDFLPGQDIGFQVDRLTYNLGETVSFVVRTKLIDPDLYDPKIEVEGPDGETLALAPEADEGQVGFYTAPFVPEREGTYTATLTSNVGKPETVTLRFNVYSDSVERRFVSADPELMERIAETTGGGRLALEEWNSIPDLVRDFELKSSQETRFEDVWDTLLVFACVVLLLGLEWFFRRRAGLA